MRHDDETDSIWLRDEKPPSRQSPLTRARIVERAVTILDRHGVDGLTMRLLAKGLNVTATALYWHVRTKDDVLDLALDHIFGDVPLPAPTADWRNDVRRLIRSWRSAMLRHPWAPGLTSAVPRWARAYWPAPSTFNPPWYAAAWTIFS